MKQNNSKSIVFGVLALAAGALLMGFNLGLLPAEYKHVVFSWPMLLTAIGFTRLFSRRNRFFGVILMAVGGFFLLSKLDIARLDFITENGWAIALVAAGIFILHKALFRRNYFWTDARFHSSPAFDCGSECREKFRRRAERRREHSKSEAGYIDRNYVFGGCNEKLDIREFRGGDINCVFGGVELDLTGSELAGGVHVLEINSVFGGCVLYLPATWNIEIRQSQVFGRFADNRPKIGFEVDEKSTLIIEASSVFGGGEIKCK